MKTSSPTSQYDNEYIQPINQLINWLSKKVPTTIINIIFEEYIYDENQRFLLDYDLKTGNIKVKMSYKWLNQINYHKIQNPPETQYIGINDKNSNRSTNHYLEYDYYKINEYIHYFVTSDNYSLTLERDLPPNCIYYHNGLIHRGKPAPFRFPYFNVNYTYYDKHIHEFISSKNMYENQIIEQSSSSAYYMNSYNNNIINLEPLYNIEQDEFYDDEIIIMFTVK
jgi:hypothetical protein